MLPAPGVVVEAEGGGEPLLSDDGPATTPLLILAAVSEPVPEPEPELRIELLPEPIAVPVSVPEPEPVSVVPVLEELGLELDPNPAPPLNFPAKHCVIIGTSLPPLGVKLRTYVLSKLPAAQPTQPKKLAEFAFRKSNAAHTFCKQLGLLLPPPVSESKA